MGTNIHLFTHLIQTLSVMGLLINGVWHSDTPGFKSTKQYIQHHNIQESKHQNWITKDGSAGPTGNSGFKAESGRYHLYYSPGCPFAHRASIIIHLKHLEKHISTSICSPYMYCKDGWHFNLEDNSTGDSLYNKYFLHEIYTLGDSNYTGTVSVPLLWDKHNKKIVSTESLDIFRMLNTAFNDITENYEDFSHFDKDIEGLNNQVLNELVWSIYKVGFSQDQKSYDSACENLLENLKKWDEILMEPNYRKFISGDKPLEPDFLVFVMLIRFDIAYYYLYKANNKRIADFRDLTRWMRDVYNYKDLGVNTVDVKHIKNLYYRNEKMNPGEIVASGPELP